MIPHVERGKLITADRQNDLINQVNEHGEDIENLKAASGDPEAVQGLINTSLFTHYMATEPHPAYDDMADLTAIFENGLV